jgi:neutral trehalase
MIQAARQLGDLLEAGGRTNEAQKWRQEDARVCANVRSVFWDKEVGLFRSATGSCNVPDIWGSAFAVWLGVADEGQAKAIAQYFKVHYAEIVQDGQVPELISDTLKEDFDLALYTDVNL